MARYRKIDVRMWADARVRRLSAAPPNGQTLWIYLLTNPETTNIPGLYRAGEAGLAEALGWSLEGFREAFGEAFGEGLVEADWKARLIWIPNAIKHNAPESPNVVRSWRVAWDELPECELKAKAFEHLKDFLEAFGEAFAKAFGEACPKPSPNQEQEQEQEQDQKQKLAGSADASPPSAPALRMPCVGQGPEAYDVAEAQLAEWSSAFPGVDVAAEVRRAQVWLDANPTRRKTHKGMPRFLVAWLSRAQDHGAAPAAKPSPRTGSMRAEDCHLPDLKNPNVAEPLDFGDMPWRKEPSP